MKDYKYVIDYLTFRMLARMSHVQMWVYAEEGMFEDAMQSQFNFLVYEDIATEMYNKMTQQQTDTLMNLFTIAYGGLQ